MPSTTARRRFAVCRERFHFSRGGNERLRADTFKPYLAPVGVNAPRTEEATFAVAGLAHDGIEDDAGRFHFSYFPRSLVHDSVDTTKDPVGAAAVGNLFRIEIEAAIPAVGIERFQNLIVPLNAHEFTRLEVQSFGWSGLTGGNSTGLSRKWGAAPQEIEMIVKPTQRPAHADSRTLEPKEEEISPAADDAPEADIAGSIVLDVLVEFPPLEVGTGIR